MRPVEHTTTSPADTSERRRRPAPRCVGVAKPSGPVHTLAPPELSTTACTMPSLTTWRVQRTGWPDHAVGGEDRGADVVGTVVDDQGEVWDSGGLEPGGDAGGPESLRGGDAHGATPSVVRTGRLGQAQGEVHATGPRRPAVPLTRLSSAQIATTVPAIRGRVLFVYFVEYVLLATRASWPWATARSTATWWAGWPLSATCPRRWSTSWPATPTATARSSPGPCWRRPPPPS